jgi:hypothetical protein
MEKLKKIFQGMTFRKPHVDDTLRHVFHGLHGVYFGSVFLEGHGVYAMASGGLLVLLVLNYFLHFD